MKDIYFYLPNEGLEGLERIVLIFYAHINTAFCFYIYYMSIASGQLWFMTFLWCGRHKIAQNYENSVSCGSLSQFLVLDRVGGLIIYRSACFSVFNQMKMWVKIQHQMEVLNPIYMSPNMTALTKVTKRQKFWVFILHCLMKRDGIDRMFPFAKQDISERGSRYEPRNK